MLKKIKLIGSSVAFLSPLAVLAQGLFDIETNIVDPIKQIVDGLLPIVIGIAILVFFWGLVKYIFSQGSEEAKADGKKIMFWGAVALFVMFSIWGIIRLAQEAFGIRDDTGAENVGSIIPPDF